MWRGVSDRGVSIVAALVCLSAVAALIVNIDGLPLTPPASSVNDLFTDSALLLYPTILLLWGITLALTLFTRKRRGRVITKDKPHSDNRLLIGLLLLALLMIIVSLGHPGGFNPSISQSPGGQEGDSSNDPILGNDVQSAAISVLSLIPLAIVLAVIVLLVWRHMKWSNRSVLPKNIPSPEEPKAHIEAALVAINEGSDVRMAILQAYREMCRMTHRSPEEQKAMTPRELEADVLARLPWPSSHLGRLTDLFEEARYSHHALDEEKRTMAQISLRALLVAEGGDHIGG